MPVYEEWKPGNEGSSQESKISYPTEAVPMEEDEWVKFRQVSQYYLIMPSWE